MFMYRGDTNSTMFMYRGDTHTHTGVKYIVSAGSAGHVHHV